MAEVRWLRPALRQLAAQIACIAQHVPVAADKIGARLEAAADSLETVPNRGRPGIRPGRRELVTVPPCIIEYVVERDGVSIVRLRHGRQRAR